MSIVTGFWIGWCPYSEGIEEDNVCNERDLEWIMSLMKGYFTEWCPLRKGTGKQNVHNERKLKK